MGDERRAFSRKVRANRRGGAPARETLRKKPANQGKNLNEPQLA
jgi:hypothetical protein